jgi:predicted nucleic acid-binding protein
VSTRRLAVVDTNVALDLLLFEDPRCGAFRAALSGGRVQWIASPAMRAELAGVLARGFGDRWPVADPRPLLAAWDGWAHVVAEPAACGLDCSDRDDQMFIDLAFAHRPCRLLTRDRALLRLAGRAARCAVEVGPPGSWPADKDAGG